MRMKAKLVALFFLQSIHAATIISYNIEMTPNTVGETNASIYLFVQLRSALDGDDYLNIVLPSQMQLTATPTCRINYTPDNVAAEKDATCIRIGT